MDTPQKPYDQVVKAKNEEKRLASFREKFFSSWDLTEEESEKMPLDEQKENKAEINESLSIKKLYELIEELIKKKESLVFPKKLIISYLEGFTNIHKQDILRLKSCTTNDSKIKRCWDNKIAKIKLKNHLISQLQDALKTWEKDQVSIEDLINLLKGKIDKDKITDVLEFLPFLNTDISGINLNIIIN